MVFIEVLSAMQAQREAENLNALKHNKKEELVTSCLKAIVLSKRVLLIECVPCTPIPLIRNLQYVLPEAAGNCVFSLILTGIQ